MSSFSSPHFPRHTSKHKRLALQTTGPNYQNKYGLRIAKEKSLVAAETRTFFFAKWVAVKSLKQFSDKERLAIIIEPDTGAASAHFCIKSNLSHQALADISTADSGAKITFCITEKSASKPSTSFSAIQIILK